MHLTAGRSGMVRACEGVELRTLRWAGREPGFVLVHGLASNALLWQAVAHALSEDGDGHAVTAVDLRGHGASSTPVSGYDTSTAAADVATVIGELGLDRPVVVGQSWGGNVAVELAAGRSDRVAAIALVDGGWIALRDSFDTWASVLATLTPPNLAGRSAAEISATIRLGHPDWADWAIEATLANLRECDDATMSARLALANHLSILRSMWDHSITDRFADIRVPALLIPAGSRTESKSAAVGAAQTALHRSQVRWYEDADHDLHAQHPGSLATDLLGLADRVGL